MLVGATAGEILTLFRSQNFDRETDYQESGDFASQTVDDDFNRTINMLQQLRDTEARTLQYPITGTVFATILPEPVVGEILVVNATKTGFDSDDGSSLLALASNAAAAAASAAAAAISETNADNDATATAADVVTTNAAVVTTNADVVTTNADAAATAIDAIATAADVIATAADAVSTGNDAIATAADAVSTDSDVTDTGNDAIATAADAVSTDADATAAAASASAAAASFTDFDTRYLGAKAVAPTLDNVGGALIDGALYYDTVLQDLRVYDTTLAAWATIGSYAHPNHTGDVTSVSDGIQTIANDVVTNAKLKTMLPMVIKMRNAGTTGQPMDVKVSSLTQKTSPGLGDVVLGEESGGDLRKFAVGSLGAPVIQSSAIADHFNLVCTSPTVSTLDIDADALIVTHANGDRIKLLAIDETVDITVSGAGGLDTGSEAASTMYFFYIIYDSNLDLTESLLSLSATAPTLPSGYEYFALIGGTLNNSSSDFPFYLQNGNDALIDSILVLTDGSNESNTPIDLGVAIPSISKQAHGLFQVDSTNTNRARMVIFKTADNSSQTARFVSPDGVGSNDKSEVTILFGIDTTTVHYAVDQASTNATLQIIGYNYDS